MSTMRSALEDRLRELNFTEVAPGDWYVKRFRRQWGALVRLDIAHSPGMAWYTPLYPDGSEMATQELSYEQVIRRLT